MNVRTGGDRLRAGRGPPRSEDGSAVAIVEISVF